MRPEEFERRNTRAIRFLAVFIFTGMFFTFSAQWLRDNSIDKAVNYWAVFALSGLSADAFYNHVSRFLSKKKT